jgi:hypothetical protein
VACSPLKGKEHVASVFIIEEYAKQDTGLDRSEFLATDQEVWVQFPTLPDFLRSSGSGTGSTQPLFFFIYNLNQQSEFTFSKLMLWLLKCLDGASYIWWRTSCTYDMPRSACSVALETYHGASTVVLRILDWLLWIIDMLDLLAQPHNSRPYVQICMIMVL